MASRTRRGWRASPHFRALPSRGRMPAPNSAGRCPPPCRRLGWVAVRRRSPGRSDRRIASRFHRCWARWTAPLLCPPSVARLRPEWLWSRRPDTETTDTSPKSAFHWLDFGRCRASYERRSPSHRHPGTEQKWPRPPRASRQPQRPRGTTLPDTPQRPPRAPPCRTIPREKEIRIHLPQQSISTDSPSRPRSGSAERVPTVGCRDTPMVSTDRPNAPPKRSEHRPRMPVACRLTWSPTARTNRRPSAVLRGRRPARSSLLAAGQVPCERPGVPRHDPSWPAARRCRKARARSCPAKFRTLL